MNEQETYPKFRELAIKYGFTPFDYDNFPDINKDATNYQAIRKALKESLSFYPLMVETDLAKILELDDKNVKGKKAEEIIVNGATNNRVYNAIKKYTKAISISHIDEIKSGTLEEVMTQSFNLSKNTRVGFRDTDTPRHRYSRRGQRLCGERRGNFVVFYLDIDKVRERLLEEYKHKETVVFYIRK